MILCFVFVRLLYGSGSSDSYSYITDLVLDLYPTHISVIENKHYFLLQIIADKKFAEDEPGSGSVAYLESPKIRIRDEPHLEHWFETFGTGVFLRVSEGCRRVGSRPFFHNYFRTQRNTTPPLILSLNLMTSFILQTSVCMAF